MKKILPVFLLLIFHANLTGQAKFTDNRDGNVYPTMSVSGVIWMAENLRYKAKSGAFYFDNDSNNNQGYGILYEWQTARNSCPGGWHLPSGNEFQALINYFDHRVTWQKTGSDSSSFRYSAGRNAGL